MNQKVRATMVALLSIAVLVACDKAAPPPPEAGTPESKTNRTGKPDQSPGGRTSRTNSGG